MIIAIDGPAGAGKSTVAKMLADRLGFCYLDTGAMYRSVTWAAMKNQIDLGDTKALEQLASKIQIAFVEDDVLVDGEVVTLAIRTPEVTENVGFIADAVGVREQLVRLQREIAKRGNYVCEGRDQGTVVFPDSTCKIFLTATSHQRAKRRVEQLKASGKVMDIETVEQQQIRRDHQDASRPVGQLRRADDAIEVVTDDMTIEQVVDELEKIARSKMKSD